MIIIALILLVILTSIAALHLYWALGGLWPTQSAEKLVQTVIGSRTHRRMPGKWLTIFVAGMIFVAGLFPLLHVTQTTFGTPERFLALGMGLITLVFLGRGLITYLVPSVNKNAAEPFRTLNFRYFSPLCLILGSVFAGLLVFS